MQPIVILGPTAAGKTKLAVELAKQLGGEIISADSMQVYRGMDIGTAKPTMEERQGVPHHLIDVRDPDQEWTVSDFVEQTNQLTDQLAAWGKAPIIVGGTGLYLWSLLEGFAFPLSPADKELRARLELESTSILYSRLSTIDPPAAAKIHANDKKRIIRALEVYELTGQPISKLQELRTSNVEHRTSKYLLIGLDPPREELYKNINKRVDTMLEKGLVEEVKGLREKGYGKDIFSMQALGYKEVFEYLDGHWTLDFLTAELKKRTRHFARRQMTWFRRFKEVKWFPPSGTDKIYGIIAS